MSKNFQPKSLIIIEELRSKLNEWYQGNMRRILNLLAIN